MRKLLLLLTLAPFLAFGQMTYVPDDNFEQELIDLGYDTGTPDDSVPTANISSVTILYVNSKNITDLTGIEDFTALTDLACWGNQLTSLDVSNNTALTWLSCGGNQLSSLDVSNNNALTVLSCYGNQLTSLVVSNNTSLTYLECSWNQLTSLDVSNNTALTYLDCRNNLLTSLDVSNNTALTLLSCYGNQLTSLDVSNNTALTQLGCGQNNLFCLNVTNGNNNNMVAMHADDNPNLTCIEVDDVGYSNTNWVGASFLFDPQTSFSEDCNYPTPCDSIITGIIDHPTKPKQLLTITDILGRTTLPTPNTLLFYIYDDGSVEKTIFLDD